MQVFASLDSIPEEEFLRGSAIAIGKFDGVHRGHQALLSGVFSVAETHDLDAVVFTFANNPLGFLRPDRCPPPLMSREQRLEALAAEGVETCVMVPFDAAFAAMPAEQFVERILIGQLRVRHICVGADFRFGHRGLGDAAMLEQMGTQHGFTVEIIQDVADQELGKVSSSNIREALMQGDVDAAGRMLGRPATLRGEVVRGDARGRELGFPTANLGGDVEGFVPADGVYAGWAIIDGAAYVAAISVGANVTFDPAGIPRVEAYLLDFHEDIYGKTLEVCFAQRLRDMTAFATVDALIDRMNEDVRETRQLLGG